MGKHENIIDLTNENFDQVTGNGVSMVDFWATWCYPCRLQVPILEKVADHIGSKARICKLNVDENQELAMKYGITGIPALLIFKDGKIVHQFIGLQQEKTLISTLESFI